MEKRKRVAKVGLTCRLCHPNKHFRDLYDAGKHMRGFHKLVAETRTVRGQTYNTGYWVKRK